MQAAWVLLVAGLTLGGPPSAGAVLDWSSLLWTDGDGNGSGPYTVGPYEATVTVTYSGGSNIDSTDGSILYPRIQNWASLNDDALGLWMDCATDNGSSNYLTVEIELDQAVAGVFFTLADIDTGSSGRYNDRYSNWQDIVVVSAFQGTTRRTVTGTALDGTPSFATDTDGNDYDESGDLSLYANTGNISGSDDSGDILVRITDPVDNIRILFAPGGRGSDEDGLPYAGPDNPNGQRILLGNIVVPEPTTGVMLMLCGGGAVVSRRRRTAA